MSDKLLRQTVIEELDFAPNVDAAGVGVAVSGGVVTLTGHVSSYAQKLEAGRLARQVRGARAIADEIEVRYPHDKKVADDEIAGRALAIMRREAQAPVDSILIEVERGWVTLTGDVPMHHQRVAAEEAIRKLSGVTGVTNAIRVKPTVISGDVRGAILDALNRQAEVDTTSVMIAVHNDRVSLLGKVKTWRERDIAERAAWSVPGVTAVEDRLDVG